MKIGIMGLAAWPLPMYEGKISAPQQLLEKIVLDLKSRGHEVTVFVGQDSKIDTNIISSGLNSTDHDFGPELESPVSFTERKIELDLIHAQSAIKAFGGGKIDVLNTHDIRYNPYVFAGKEIPVLYTPHTNLEIRDHDYDKYRFQLMSESENIGVANISRSNNKFCSEKGIKVYGRVPNGIDHNRFSFSEKNREGLLLVGRIVPGKKIKEAIDIAGALNQKITIVGPPGAKDPDKEYFSDVEKNYFSRDYVDYVGAKFGGELIEYFKSAKLLIYPSETEGLPLGVLEAMSTGLPVVASNVGGVPDIIDDEVDGILVDGFEIEVWKDKINIGLNINPNKCREKIEKKFTIEKMVDNYELAYKSIIDKKEFSE